MMIRAEVKELMFAARWAEKVLPGRSSQPILAGFLLEAGEDEAVLSAYDNETGARVSVPVSAAEPGRVVVSGKLLVNVLASLSKGEVELELEDGKLAIRSGGAGFQVVLLPVEDYPTLPAPPPPCGWAAAADFCRAVEEVTYAVDGLDAVNDIRIDAVRLETLNGVGHLVATDRFRVVVGQFPWNPLNGSGDVQALLSAKILKMFAKASGERVELSIPAGETGVMGLSSGGRTLTTGVHAGEYPKWQRVMSAASSKTTLVAELDKDEITGAVQRARVVTGDVSPVRLTLMEGTLQVDSGLESSMAEVIGAELLEGATDLLEVLLNPDHLLQALQAAPGEKLLMRLSETGPVMLTDTDGLYEHLLMRRRAA
jgi:DNA polymerase-3 subunit beta